MALACAADGQCTPRVPTLLLGDFNQDLVDLQRFGWVDPLDGLPTSKAAVHPRRIDWTVLNRPARWAGARVRADWGLGMPVHAGQWVEVSGGPAQVVSAWRPPRQPEPVSGGGRIDLADYWLASSAHDVDAAWDALERAALARRTR